MAIKQCMGGCKRKAFLFTLLLSSVAAVLGTGKGSNNPLKQPSPRSRRIPSCGQDSASRRIAAAEFALKRERRLFRAMYERHIKAAVQSGILSEEESVKAALEKKVCTLVARYRRNVGMAIATRSDRYFQATLHEEQDALRRRMQCLVQRLQRNMAKKAQEKNYQEQFPSLGEASSMSKKDMRRICALNNKQEAPVSARYGIGFPGVRVAIVDGVSVATDEDGFDQRVLQREGQNATERHKYPYISYIIHQILRDPEDHYFPFAIDDEVLRKGEQIQNNSSEYGKQLLYTLPGTLDGTKGIFEIGIGIDTNRGMIFHRMFRKDPHDYAENIKRKAEEGGTIIH